MERMRPPIVPEKPVPVLTEAQLRALLASAKSASFVDRRDTAIIRLLLDTGGRLSEVAGLAVADLDFTDDVAHVIGKGGVRAPCPFGQQTGLALGALLRARAKQRQADRPELWLAEKNRGALSSDGVGGNAAPARGCGRHPRPACPPVPAHRGPRVARGRRQRIRPHAPDGLEVPADAAPVRRLDGRRARSASPPAARSR